MSREGFIRVIAHAACRNGYQTGESVKEQPTYEWWTKLQHRRVAVCRPNL